MKKILIVLSAAVTAISLMSCNLQIPQSVSIKTDAKYKFTVAEYEKDLSDFSPVDSLMGSSSESYQIYKYNPGGNSEVQQLLVNLNMQEIPIDMSSYLDATDLSSVTDMNVQKDVTIPDLVNFNYVNPVNFDEIADQINESVTIGGYGEGTLIFSFDASDSFESIEYASGTLEVEGLMGTVITGSVSLKDGDTVVTTGAFVNGKASVPLTGVTLKRVGMSIDFSDYTSTDPVPYVGKIKEGSKISKVTGLTLSEQKKFPIDIDPISFGNSSDLKSCTIDVGSIDVTLDTKTWTKGMVSYEIAMTGGLETTIVGSDNPSTVSTDLHDTVIKNADIIPSAQIVLTLANSTLDFTIDPEFTFTLSISKIASATIGLPDSFDTTYTLSQDLPSALTSVIKTINWNNSGIKVKGTNTFPTDALDPDANAITLKIDSDYFFKVDSVPGSGSVTETLKAGDSAKTLSFLGDYSAETNKVLTRATADNSTVDMKVSLTLPGYDSVNNTITIKNIVPGETYSLALEVEPVFDWSSVVIKSDATAQSGSYATNMSLGNIFDSMTSILGDDVAGKIQLSKCNAYLFCETPTLSELGTPQFNGKIKMSVGKEEAGVITANPSIAPIYILGSESKDAILKAAKCPELKITETKKDDSTVIKTVTTDLEKEMGNAGINLAPVINARGEADEGLCVEYNVKFESGKAGELEISKSALSSSDVKSIKLSAVMVIPVAFKVTDDINIDVMKMVYKDEWTDTSDILNRTEEPDNSEIEDYVKVIESVAIEYATSKIPFITTNDLSVGIDFDGAGTKCKKHSLTVKGGSIEENPSNIMSLYPLHPTVTIDLPGNTEVALPNDMSMKINIKLAIQTDGDQEIKVWEMGGNE